MLKKSMRCAIVGVCVALAVVYVVPFCYFVIFPAKGETQAAVLKMNMPKGLVVEYALNLNDFGSNGRFLGFNGNGADVNLRWGPPGTFALDLPAPNLEVSAYGLWLPFLPYPKDGSMGYINIPAFDLHWSLE